MTLQLLHSEFPKIWGKFDFIFYQCCPCWISPLLYFLFHPFLSFSLSCFSFFFFPSFFSLSSFLFSLSSLSHPYWRILRCKKFSLFVSFISPPLDFWLSQCWQVAEISAKKLKRGRRKKSCRKNWWPNFGWILPKSGRKGAAENFQKKFLCREGFLFLPCNN